MNSSSKIGQNTFSKEERITNKKVIDKLFTDGKRIGVHPFDVRYILEKENLFNKVLVTAAKGKINLENEILDMRGSVAPIRLISQIISVVPAVGELITGLKKEGLFAGQFKMFGPIKKPKVKLNTLSFAPGILRDLFAEDWLNKKNFFLRNK